MTAEQFKIQDNAVCLSIQLGRPHTRRRVSNEAITTDAESRLVHVAKDIYESANLDAIAKHQASVYTYLRQRCLPSPFRRGIYLLSVKSVRNVMSQLQEFMAYQNQLIEEFLLWYAPIFDSRFDTDNPRAKALGSLYNPYDYPEPDRLRQAFSFEVQLWELNTPGKLQAIDMDLYRKEYEKMEATWNDAKDQITNVLLEEFKRMTSAMVERLTPNEDGTPKVFKNSLVGNLQDWLSIFDQRTLTDDTELVELVNKARGLVAGITPDQLRNSDTLKAQLSGEMQTITKALDSAIVDKPGRRISLED